MSDKLLAEIESVLKELADELREWVENYYASTKGYPSEQRRYERDIEPVKRARALLPRLREAVQGGGWRDIASAPKDGTLIDLWFPDFDSGHNSIYPAERVANCRWRGNPGFDIDPELDGWEVEVPGAGWTYRLRSIMREGREPAHWMPLPASPTEGASPDTPAGG